MFLAASTLGTIIATIVAFLVLTLVLVGVLIFTKDKLLPSGNSLFGHLAQSFCRNYKFVMD